MKNLPIDPLKPELSSISSTLIIKKTKNGALKRVSVSDWRC
jgi:hypothetical protein